MSATTDRVIIDRTERVIEIIRADGHTVETPTTGHWVVDGHELHRDDIDQVLLGAADCEHAARWIVECTLNVRDDQIRQLREESAQGGDLDQVRICDLALAGDAEALTECARVIADARAMDEDEDEEVSR